MTENLYETNQFTNHTNGTYLFQHSPSTLGAPHYGVPNINSIQSSPMSPRLNHESLTSPGTPGHELSPLLEMPNSGGTWEYNQFGKTSSWGSSSHEELPETSRIYPFNITCQNISSMTCKDNGSISHPQRLDSFSKAFPTKNIQLLFDDSNRTNDKHPENHISGVLHMPQSLPEGSDRQPLESPVFNPMVIQGQCDQTGFHPSESQNSMHSLYQNHQQFHYGYQQHKQKLNNMEQVNRSLQKPQSSWHGYQSPPVPYPMALNQQQRGMFAHKTYLDSQEPAQSPTFDHRQDFKVPEQQIFHYQDQQHLHSLSQPGNPYLAQDHVQSIPAKQNNMFSDARHSSPNTPVFSSPKEDQSGFNFSHRNEDLYQNKSSGVCKTLPQMTMMGEIFHHATPHASQWSKAPSPDFQDESISPHFRLEPELSREDGSHAKMRCTVCHREFKSLPALNGHMRSHGGLRTHPTSLKMRDGHILSEAAQSNPIILPVSVPVKDYQTPTKLPLNLLCQQKNEEQSGLIKTGAQSPLLSVRNHPSCIKRSVSDGGCAQKQVKKRYRHCLVPLMIPSPSSGQESRGAVLFRSQLKTASSIGDDVPYTPPPMLSPVRPGSGLFNAINGRAKSSGVEYAADGAGDLDDSGETAREKVVNVTPRINVGEEFQAKIPDIKRQTLTEEDSHNAVLLWSPSQDLDAPDNQQKVDNLLKMACSSVLPGGGANTEYVLHCLFECRGDIMNTLEKLLLPTPPRNTSSPKTDYHYAGSDRWTLQEKRQLNKALLSHHKDFFLVQKMVKTKSVSQCVEYYYTWKKRLRLGTRVSSALSTPVQDPRGDAESNKEANSKTREHEISENSSAVFVCEVSNSQMKEEMWTQTNLRLLCSSPAESRTSTLTLPLGSASVRSSPSSTTSGDTDSAVVFPCNECGKVFLKVKSRNAHMKTHRQQEDIQLWQLSRAPEQDRVMATPESHPVTPLKPPMNIHSLTCDVKTSINDMCSESMQEINCPLKTLPVLQSPLDYIPS
ncbi:transcriptional-regulating factor 1 isoform X1 [Carassius gibelio]|uniref:transcriptional-regulating factor 1 isoform X1 n=1 Tax=Carassius gibelio TaxID=101364 RepID=UPI002278F915|nr:transcriptional-regulating factor 1 isoform X1 [Carassius gibelio]XP_052436613.1 transcriptional-regulating factor 1 isoform X1 [Carassius gibelio]